MTEILKRYLIIVGLVLAMAGAFIWFNGNLHRNGNIIEINKTFNMRLISPAFSNNASIPAKYTCDAEGQSPHFLISDVPEATGSLALIVDDPDAPSGTFTHWLVWNISPETHEIKEGAVPADAVQGKNSAGKIEYQPACPPNGTHRYFFRLYALTEFLDLSSGASRSDLENAMKGKVIAEAELVGLYQRSR